jgi:hypothetical protein
MASAAIQTLIDKGLFERLPPTFSTFVFEQIKDWDLLFPAERGYFERLLALLDRSAPEAVENVFAPLRAAEKMMGVNETTWPRRRFTLDNVDFLNRNAHYPEWRQAVAQAFSKIDPLLDAEVERKGRPRLAVVLSPGELPVGPDRMWQRVRERGRMVSLEGAFDAGGRLAPLLASGDPPPYDRWVIAAGDAPARAQVTLSYSSLEAYRKRLMSSVREMLAAEAIRGPRELSARLKQLKVRESESEAGKDPVLAEFTRSVLLSGNGTLLINNTFAEWAAVNAVRRARPSLLLVSFGIRNKLKPFSNLLIYADQESANPVPTQMDMLGSYVDLEVFYQYIWQEFDKYPEYRRNTVFFFLGQNMDEMLVIAPPDFTLPAKAAPETLAGAAREWMRL